MSLIRKLTGGLFARQDGDPSPEAPQLQLDDLSGVPFTRFTEVTRRVDTDKLEPRVQEIFNFFFTRFLSNPYATPWQGDELEIVISADQGTQFIGGMARARRFAGDEMLPPGRYHALRDTVLVEHEPSTLMGELFAYFNPAVASMPTVFDRGDVLERAYPEGVPDDVEDFLLLVIDPHQPGDFPAEFGFDPTRESHIEVPVRRVRHDLHRVIDLRLPATLEWFRTKFLALEEQHKGRGGMNSSFRPLGDHFLNVIFPLVAQPLGGGSPFVQGIGAWMRSHGVDALIYPSARSDSEAISEGDRVIAQRGFLMVDYRDSEPLEWTQFFGRQSAWYPQELQHIQIDANLDNERKWYAVSGIKVVQQARMQRERRIAQDPSHPYNPAFRPPGQQG